MANVFKRKNGSYCIRVSNGKPNGKQHFITTPYYPPKELSAKAAENAAKKYAVMFETAVREGIYVPGKPITKISSDLFGITLEEFVVQHYYEKIKIRMSPNTIQLYQSVIEQCILPSFGKIRICDISSAHLQAFVDYLASPGARMDENNSEVLSGSTVKRYATIFSSIMTEAYKMGLVEKDVLHKQYISYPKIVKHSIQAYDDEEASRFFEGLKNEHPKIRALLLTSLFLGLRRGEVVGLMWSDYDFKNNCLFINRSAYKVKGQPQNVKIPKSKCSIRSVFFSDEYAQILNVWREEQERERLAAGDKWEEQGFVFTNDKGGMMQLYAPTEICSKFEERCGLRHLKLHGLRHTCGSLMIKNGVDIETVKSLFGHESIRTTQQYLSAYDSAKKSAATRITDAIIIKKGDDE